MGTHADAGIKADSQPQWRMSTDREGIDCAGGQLARSSAVQSEAAK